MADFRKVILVLAVLAIVAAPASAQLACTVTASPLQLRAEGLTERVGDTTLDCTNPSAATVVSITALYNATVTNRLTTGRVTDAYLLVNGANPIAGVLSADGHRVVWEGITIPVMALTAPGSIGITNVRVNAAALGTGPVGSASNVLQSIVVSSVSQVSVPNNQVVVGTIFNGLTFSLSDEAPLAFQACLGNNDEDTPTRDFSINFREGFASAFKRLEGTITEAGERNPVLTALSAVQRVDSGTKLRAVFTNVPAGAQIFVSADNKSTSGIVTEFDGELTGWFELDVEDGTAEAIWDILSGTDQSISQTVTFDVAVVFEPFGVTLPTGGMTVATEILGTFAPISAVGTASTSTSVPVPRFVEAGEPEDVFAIAACVTNLLFPFVSNQAGFDTGIAIVNTSTGNATGETGTPANAPFDMTPQTGTCTLFYFGAKSDGTTPAPQTTVPIGAATTSTNAANKFFEAFALSSGGPPGAAGSAASFQGYIIARCNFQFGHGFAFITDLGAQRLAQGYLALVIPDRARVADPFTTAGSGSGETLGN